MTPEQLNKNLKISFMKFEPLNFKQNELDSFKTIVKGIDLLPIEVYVDTRIKEYTQHYIFSRLASDKLYTFIVTIFVTGSCCETVVDATEFKKYLGKQDSYRSYGGGKKLLWKIDIEHDLIYYLSDLAAAALNYHIGSVMGSLRCDNL